MLLSCATNGSSSSFGIRCGAVVRGERATKCFPHLVPSWFVCSNLTRVQYNIGCSAQLTLLGEFPFPKLNVNPDPQCMRALGARARPTARTHIHHPLRLDLQAPPSGQSRGCFDRGSSDDDADGTRRVARNPNAIYIPAALCVIARDSGVSECLCKYLSRSVILPPLSYLGKLQIRGLSFFSNASVLGT